MFFRLFSWVIKIYRYLIIAKENYFDLHVINYFITWVVCINISPTWAFLIQQSESINNLAIPFLTQLNTYHWRDSKITIFVVIKLIFTFSWLFMFNLDHTINISTFYIITFFTSLSWNKIGKYVKSLLFWSWGITRNVYSFYLETLTRNSLKNKQGISFVKVFSSEIKS